MPFRKPRNGIFLHNYLLDTFKSPAAGLSNSHKLRQ